MWRKCWAGRRWLSFSVTSKASEAKLDEINQRLYTWGYKAQIYPAFTNPLTRFVNGLVYAAVGVAGALTAVQGSTDHRSTVLLPQLCQSVYEAL